VSSRWECVSGCDSALSDQLMSHILCPFKTDIGIERTKRNTVSKVFQLVKAE